MAAPGRKKASIDKTLSIDLEKETEVVSRFDGLPTAFSKNSRTNFLGNSVFKKYSVTLTSHRIAKFVFMLNGGDICLSLLV